MTAVENSPVEAPDGLAARGSALWAATVAGCDLEPHELALLTEACRTIDLLDQLEAAIAAADGLTMPWGEGVRLHPAVPEVRAQRVALARLVAALGIPAEEHVPISPEWAERQRLRRA